MNLDTTDPIAQPAFDAFAEGVRRPWNDMDTLIDLARVLYRYDDFHALVRSFEDDPAAVRLLIERPDLGIDFSSLASAPADSLGAALHARHGDDPFVCFDFGGSPVHTYLVCHLLETAPLWNTVLDTDPEDDTRILQLAFVAAQVPTAPVLAFLARNLSKVGLERFDRHDAAMGSLVQGWTLGRRARSLLGADWRTLIQRPLAEVRQSFGISEADVAKNRRCSSALRTAEPVLTEGVDTEAFLEAMGRIVLLPYGGTGFETGAALREALVNPPRIAEFAKQMFADTSLAARAEERPRLGDLDLTDLHELPSETLGRVFGDHLALKEFDPPPQVPEDESDFARYFTGHIIETHDVWHVVTGARTDKAGECALHSFYTGQLRPLPVQLAYVARCILKTAIWDMDLALPHLDGVARGWLLARSVDSLALVDWRAHFDTPLAEVRERFGIPAQGIDAVELDTGDLV